MCSEKPLMHIASSHKQVFATKIGWDSFCPFGQRLALLLTGANSFRFSATEKIRKKCALQHLPKFHECTLCWQFVSWTEALNDTNSKMSWLPAWCSPVSLFGGQVQRVLLETIGYDPRLAFLTGNLSPWPIVRDASWDEIPGCKLSAAWAVSFRRRQNLEVESKKTDTWDFQSTFKVPLSEGPLAGCRHCRWSDHVHWCDLASYTLSPLKAVNVSSMHFKASTPLNWWSALEFSGDKMGRVVAEGLIENWYSGWSMGALVQHKNFYCLNSNFFVAETWEDIHWYHICNFLEILVVAMMHCWVIPILFQFPFTNPHTIYYILSIYFFHQIFVPSEIQRHLYIHTLFFLHFQIWPFWPQKPKNSNLTNSFLAHYPQTKMNQKSP